MPVDLEDPQPVAELVPALRKGVQAGAEEDELGGAGGDLLGHQVLDEAGAGHDRGAKAAGAGRVHVGPIAPTVVGRDELQAQPVIQHVRRRVDLHVQGSPQRGAHGGVVGFLDVVVGHGPRSVS